jgi:hypothetical protein
MVELCEKYIHCPFLMGTYKYRFCGEYATREPMGNDFHFFEKFFWYCASNRVDIPVNNF